MPGEQFLLGAGLPACGLGDALRPFVDREEAADAVAGAVGVVEPGLPQVLPRQAVELAAARALGEHRAGERDMALQHAGEAVLAFRRSARRADPDGAGDVGGAVGILPARIDQIDAARLERRLVSSLTR